MISTLYERLPDGISGFTVYDTDSDYIIIINSNNDTKEQLRKYQEEVDKIESGFYVEAILSSWYGN